jgi:glutathione S-transferase
VITVHYLKKSRAHRLLWLLEELGLPYEIKLYDRDPKTFAAPAELRAIHPLGKSPVLVDGGLTLAESGAIFEYLLGRYDSNGLVPPVSSEDWPRYLYWMHSAEGSAMPLLVNKLIFSHFPTQTPVFIRPLAKAVSNGLLKALIEPQLPRVFDTWEAALGEHQWFAGDQFSAADIMMSYPVEAGSLRGDATAGRPRLAAYVETIKQRTGYQLAAERAGGYAVI